ncbi:MAG TPA: cyanophycin synthetase [Isosphaeraceae bacterium]|jgi:cyanophycin synthetase|nr:cyanophycin synthetase [Isosphaeraceae bacterium]
MDFRKILALRGPNLWANFPVLEAWVDLGEFKDSPSDSLPGLADRLMAWLPTMIEHRCGLGYRGGFFERLRTGTYLGHILEHVALELQTLAGSDVGYGKARETAEEGVYKVVVEYEEEAVGRDALHRARALILAAVHDRPCDVDGEVQALRELLHKSRLGPSTASIVAAATRRGIPSRRLNAESLVLLGQGARAHRILASETDRTPAIGEAIAQDKEMTRALLKAVGVPVPEGRPVADAEDAWAAAEEIGAAVVVKPQYGNQGRGVATDLRTREQVVTAYAAAREESSYIMVERFATGADHRLLVVGDRVVAAARREPAQVVGDGVATILELVDRVNLDPRRGDDHATVLSKIKLDTIALAVLSEQGYTPASVPTAGAKVLIRRNANLSTGGTAEDVTDRVHPEVAARAIDAAKVVGLDVAGVDVVAGDIGTPLEEQGGIIVEVNAAPGLRMHLEPSTGTPRDVGDAILSLMFPEGDDGRIPLVAVTGVNGKTTTTRLVAHILGVSGKVVGMTNTDGIYIGGRRIESGDCSGPKSARNVLLNPRVEAAALEVARGGILREGLGFDRCDVAIVTNIGSGDHLGLADIATTEQLAKVKRTIVDVVKPTGTAVLNAADPLVAAMTTYCPGSTLYFALDEHEPALAAHRAQGGKVAFVRGESLYLADGAEEVEVIAAHRIPVTHGGKVGFQVANALAAAAASWSLGVPVEEIREGLETFRGDMRQAPGRFNVLHAHDATVILDYGHNPSAVEALAQAVGQFQSERRVAAFSAAGDRRDEDIVRQGEILGHAFDRVLIFEDCNRGRAPGEVMALLRRGLEAGSRVREIVEVEGEHPAVELALGDLRPGDLVLIQPDDLETTPALVRRLLAELPRAAVEPAPEPVDVPEAEALDACTGASRSVDTSRVVLQG